MNNSDEIRKQEELRRQIEEQRREAERRNLQREEELRRIREAFNRDKENIEKAQQGRPKDERPHEDD